MHPDRMTALIGFRNQVGILRGLVRDKESRLYTVLIKHIQELFRQIGRTVVERQVNRLCPVALHIPVCDVWTHRVD